jgi:hypothetical protein
MGAERSDAAPDYAEPLRGVCHDFFVEISDGDAGQLHIIRYSTYRD